MSLLEITGLSHAFGDNLLFKEAKLSLNKGEHAGVVGANGAGKSTLIRICTGQILPDAGQVKWQPGITAGYLDQYARIAAKMPMKEFLRLAFRKLYEMERKMSGLYERAAQGDPDSLRLAARCQEILEANDFYMADTRIEQVASGLGLYAAGLDRPVGQMSGGQRAKVILAKLLLEKPDVLLLDEPTNFLDQEHVEWLASYLMSLSNAFLVVSHDHAFLERAAGSILDIDNKGIAKYVGTYSEFLKKKAFMQEDYKRRYCTQQKEIRITEEFIRRNIAGRKSKMARGRQKQLNRLEKIEALEQTACRPHFDFAKLPFTNTEHLTVRNLTAGYDEPILRNIQFSVRGGEKVVITGFNGVGKSTLLKTLTGQIPPLGGEFSFSDQVRQNYFEQDLVWEQEAWTPIQIVSRACPSLKEREVRKLLARAGIKSLHAAQAVGTLSGGEQAKVKMCLLVIRPCNFLILDEPTNHMDALAKEALKEALSQFSGTVLLVSHEEAFYRDWAQRTIQINCKWL